MANEKRRLIDANALSEKIGNMKFEITHNRGGYRYCNEDEKNEWDKLDGFDSLVCEAPTVDAVEVVHGYWIDSYSVDHMGRIVDHGIDCSVCDSVFKDDSREVVKRWKERFKVCPFCGAQMDGEKDNEER